LTRAALALASLALMAAFWAGAALKSAFLRAATFVAAFNCLTNAAFLLGSVALAILALIFSTFLASNFLVIY